MMRASRLVVAILWSSLITILQPISSSIADEPVDVGSYVCIPSSHVCTNGFGISVKASVYDSAEFGTYLFLLLYFEHSAHPHDPIPEQVFYVSSANNHFNTSEIWVRDTFCYFAVLTRVSGRFVSPHEFHAVVDYELLNMAGPPPGCSEDPPDCATSFEFIGRIMPVPVDNSTWGCIKSLYR